jgi:hypothetical protein
MTDTTLLAQANREALIRLVRMESNVIAAFAAGPAVTPLQKANITHEVVMSTVLMNPERAWRSRPQALALVAETLRRFCLRREINAGDVRCAMGAIEASWDLDPELTLTGCGGEMREAFDLWIEELTERGRD